MIVPGFPASRCSIWTALAATPRGPVAFVGQIGAMHGWRNDCWSGSRRRAFRCAPALRRGCRQQRVCESSSLNGSLNGDLNMRVFEVLSAGGFLLTDRVSQQAGLELLLRSGQDCETYEEAEELFDKLAFYRRSPAAALQIAEQGAATYRRTLLAEGRIGAAA